MKEASKAGEKPPPAAGGEPSPHLGQPAMSGAATADEQLRPRHGRLRRKRVAVVLASVAAMGFVVAGFLRFAAAVAVPPPDVPPAADAIVVLTGGSDRVAQALTLLDEGRAKRLLISGVHPATTPQQIASRTASQIDLFTCCIDLDRKALNTSDNAHETAKWVRDWGFGRLLVVTSAYHMPRSLLELHAAMPEVTLVPYPVVREDLDISRWYTEPETARLLIREYMKYMLARFRTGVEPPGPQSAAAAGASQVRP